MDGALWQPGRTDEAWSRKRGRLTKQRMRCLFPTVWETKDPDLPGSGERGRSAHHPKRKETPMIVLDILNAIWTFFATYVLQ